MNLDSRDLARILGPILHRIDMMTARGFLVSVNDANGVQTMQVGVLADEIVDDAERFQSYGVSSVPPAGGDVLLLFVQGNRDHPIIVTTNDRISRPTGLRVGEVEVYNNADVSILLNADGDLVIDVARDASIKAKRDITIECEGTLRLKAQSIEIDTPAKTFILETHRHTDVQGGTGTSGEPV